MPVVSDAASHRAFAQKLVQGVTPQASSSDAVPSAAAAIAAEGPRFYGSEWQRPKRGGEVEILLLITYWIAILIDRMLGRELMSVAWGPVPQTEWPRLFANWKLTV